MNTYHPLLKIITLVFMAFLLTVFQPSFAAMEIVIINNDAPDEGFNDSTSFTPSGGNPSITLGDARYFAFQFAAHIWGSNLTSVVKVEVDATFDPLPCNATSAVLGRAGTNSVHRDFPDPNSIGRKPNTLYPQALANSIATTDLDPLYADISAIFNSGLDNGSCMGGTKWYYGIDGKSPTDRIDFVSVVLHELAHGLGFSTFVNLASGTKLLGKDDIYMLNLQHQGVGAYKDLNDIGRVTASISEPDLRWTGFGVEGVQMHAPNPQQPGSSVSHFSTSLFPDQLMEPSYTGANHNVGFALQLMEDIGWELSDPGIDIAIILDLTGSTESEVTGWYEQLPALFNEWKKDVPSVRFALLTHVDFPYEPYGVAGEWPYRMEVSFKNGSVDNMKNAFSRLKDEHKYGNDGPESQYEALYQVLTNGEQGLDFEGINGIGEYDETVGEIRPSSLGRDFPLLIYLFTSNEEDSGFHNPETEPNYPTSGYNEFVKEHGKTTVHKKMREMGSTTTFIGLTVSSSVSLRRGSKTIQEMQEMADITGGAVFDLDSESGSFSERLLESLKKSISVWKDSPQGIKLLGKDKDSDGITEGDNCPQAFNPEQTDSDGDGIGDVCDDPTTFPTTVMLNLTTDGEGNISTHSADCDTDCTKDSYTINTEISLTAIPASGYQFNSWTGDCSGMTAELNVTLDKAKSCTATFTVIEIPNEPPVAALAVTPETGEAPLTITLDGSASTDSDGTIVSYVWTSSDGQTVSGQNVQLTFNNVGDYTITLEVIDNERETTKVQKVISVQEVPNINPTATFSITPNSGEAPLTVTLDGSASTDTDGTIASYKWTASNGQTAEGQNAQLIFTDAGDYTITLEVTDDKGTTNSATSNASATIPEIVGNYRTSGTIRDEVGNPIAGITIQIDGQTVTTDAVGNWEIGNLPTGEYTAIATKDGLTFIPVDFEVGNNQTLTQIKLEALNDVKARIYTKIHGQKAEQGKNITYVITVVNGSGKMAINNIITYQIPTGTELVRIQGMGEVTCNGIVCNLPDLPVGASSEIEVELTIGQISSTLVNQVTLTFNDLSTDVAKSWTRAKPYLSIFGKATPSPVTMGGTLHYLFDIELNDNVPNGEATGINLTVALPKELTLESAPANCDTSNLPVITCSIENLSVATPEDISKVTISIDTLVEEPGLIKLITKAEVSSDNYDAHYSRIKVEVDTKGAEVDGVIVMDVTHSMSDQINGVIRQVKQLLIDGFADGATPLIAVVTFRDEDDIKLVAATRNLETLLTAVENLEAKDGGMCPEASADALLLGLSHLKLEGTLIFITDAPSYDDVETQATLEQIQQILIDKNINSIPIITEVNCDGGNVE